MAPREGRDNRAGQQSTTVTTTTPTTTNKKAGPTAPLTPEQAAAKKLQKEASQQYGRGQAVHLRGIKDKKLRGVLRAQEERLKDAVLRAKAAEILLENDSGFLEPEHELERTYKARQDDIRGAVGVETAKKGFELKLTELGPYTFTYSRNGKELALAGRKGHVASMDWRSGKLNYELHLGETVHAVTYLHNSQYLAVAQKKNVYIYDHHGVEIHNLDQHIDVTHMEFLPYHYLLATIGRAGWLKWQDTSTGKLVMQMSTKQKTPTAFAQNPHNAILNVGHQNGTVTMWSPNSTAPLVSMLAHRGPVSAIAIDREGKYMVSTGLDKKMSVWDVRNTKPVHEYFLRTPGSSVAISDRDLTAVGWGTQATVWKGLFTKNHADVEQVKVQSPYMAWGAQNQAVERVRWCPFEDILGIGHDQGFSSIIVPGAGEANFDALELNPYENTKQRQEAEVKSLLNKLQPEMIGLDPNAIGTLDSASHEQRQREKDLDRKTGAEAEKERIENLSKRGRGRNSSLRKLARKKGNKGIIDEHRMKVIELRERQRKQAKEASQGKAQEELGTLARFVRKGT